MHVEETIGGLGQTPRGAMGHKVLWIFRGLCESSRGRQTQCNFNAWEFVENCKFSADFATKKRNVF